MATSNSALKDSEGQTPGAPSFPTRGVRNATRSACEPLTLMKWVPFQTNPEAALKGRPVHVELEVLVPQDAADGSADITKLYDHGLVALKAHWHDRARALTLQFWVESGQQCTSFIRLESTLSIHPDRLKIYIWETLPGEPMPSGPRTIEIYGIKSLLTAAPGIKAGEKNHNVFYRTGMQMALLTGGTIFVGGPRARADDEWKEVFLTGFKSCFPRSA